MPTITLENDPTTFTIEVNNKGNWLCDAFQLQHEIAKQKPPSLGDANQKKELTADETIANIDAVTEAARSVVIRADDNKTEAKLTDPELFSIGSKVMTELEKLGK